jgi:hypothetical protein
LALLREASTWLSLTMQDFQFADEAREVTEASDLTSELISRARFRER